MNGTPRNVIGSRAGDGGGDQHADGGDDQDGDPHFFQHLEPNRGAAVEQDVAGTEDQDQLVDRRIRLDVDQPEHAGADQHADQQEHHHVGHSRQSRQQAGERAYAENDAEHQQGVFGEFQ